MTILTVALYALAIIFCILGFMNHTTAWAAAALCFFAATMVVLRNRDDK